VFTAAIDVRQSFAVATRASQAITAMSCYLRALTASRRVDPQDDLLTRLVHEEADGDRLTDDEIVAMCCLLLISGNETGVNLIGNGMFALLSHVGGSLIRRGDSVCLMLAAANRDPERFTNPATLDLARTNNRHLTFGGGIHMCLGAALARLEGQIALSVMLRRLHDVRLAGIVEWRDLIASRGLRELPIAFAKA
jgi:cytochrome P450